MIVEGMLQFFAGLVAGVILGLFVAAVCVAAARGNRDNG